MLFVGSNSTVGFRNPRLDNGADVNLAHERDLSPVFWAVMNQQIEIVRLLVNYHCHLSVGDCLSTCLEHRKPSHYDQMAHDQSLQFELQIGNP